MPKILFFGRDACVHTEQALTHLKGLAFDVMSVKSRARNETLPEHILAWEGDYIFCFRSLYILPKQLIDRAEFAAINFHPGPPEYPGSGCLNFALYDDAASYGVTAHIMNEKIDNGAIIECRRFPILSDDRIESLLEKSHHAMFDLFLEITTEVSESGFSAVQRIDASKDEVWNGPARRIRELDALKIVDAGCSRTELRETYPIGAHGQVSA